MSKAYMLTTHDNPFDPFEEYTLWMLFDKDQGYNTSERLMRLANITDDMTQKEMNEEVYRAIDRLIELDFTNTFVRVEREVEDEEDEEDDENTQEE